MCVSMQLHFAHTVDLKSYLPESASLFLFLAPSSLLLSISLLTTHRLLGQVNFRKVNEEQNS